MFRRFSARDLLLLSAACGLIRWGLMGWTTALPGLILAQILHCGTFHGVSSGGDADIAARQGSEVIRLQAVYSAVAMGGSIAIMTVFAGFLYQHLHQGVFWVMALLTLPAMAIRPKSGGGLVLEHGADMLLLAFSEVVLRVDQRRRKQRQRRRIGVTISVTLWAHLPSGKRSTLWYLIFSGSSVSSRSCCSRGLFNSWVVIGKQQHLFLVQVAFLHQPGAKITAIKPVSSSLKRMCQGLLEFAQCRLGGTQ